MKFAEYAKMYMALAGLIAAGVVGVPDIPLWAKLPLEIAIAITGAFAVWKVENRDPEPPAPNWKSAGPAWEAEGDVYDYDDVPPPAPLRMVGRKAVQEAPVYRLVA